ncbi:TatD family hydrolase [Marivirga harenae]|uniref:TatD family hydrolase n=1 Tax=Marivirga harenae TaxID=2010992 RepID=UPI0026E0B6BB|nr:TatD family hydrolase [Marivirga harenae]WKV11571.1 TatD family hydrolase [Marivirga harenae]|tara:strand:- start:62544 stop:63299 length:756 start_codon:yes stop_codon:yes gene_type:complete
MIETHAHLYAEKFDEDRPEMMDRAVEAGVEKFYMPNIDHESIEPMLEVEDRFTHTIATMGVHPCSIEKHFEKQLYEVEDWLNKRKFVAVGEIGLDFYWDKSLMEEQKEALKIQIALAKKHQIPIILHCRDSFDETYEIVKEMKDDALKGVFHCFTGNAVDAQKVIDLDFFVGIGGVVTFKNGGVAEHIPDIDINRIVLETDAPYLAPTPKRGKRNEPAYLDLIAQKIADLKQISKEELVKITSTNANQLFA